MQSKTIGWNQRLKALKTLPTAACLLWEAAPGILTTVLILRVIAAVIPLGVLAVARIIIDRVVYARDHGGNFSAVWPLLALEFVIASAGLIAGRAIDYCDFRMSEKFTLSLSLRVMKQAARVDLASLEDPEFNNMMERARLQATDRSAILNTGGALLQSIFTTISLIVGCATFAPWLPLVVALCALPAFAGETGFAFQAYELARVLTPIRRQLDYVRSLGTSLASAREVKMFGLTKYLRERFESLANHQMEQTNAMARRRLGWGVVLGTLASLGYYGSYCWLVHAAFYKQITVGTLTFLAGAVAATSTQLQSIFNLFSGLSEHALYLTDLVEFLAVEPTIRSKKNAVAIPRPIQRGIEFRDVSFHYPGSDRQVLKKLNLCIRPDERIALVGENGQGKTTIVKLLTRLYEPTEGTILLDGRDLRDYKLEGLRREIGVIFQDFFRYDFSVRENIGTGRVETVGEDDVLWEAAEKSRAADLIDRFPSKLDQMLGRRFEGGVDLSGGQWQKIALARAYVRNAQLLILDEPTASLDPAAESEIFTNFADLTRDRMALLISHRFSTVRMADRIVVLVDGAIAEDGTHDALMSQGGLYARLFDLQASSYR